MVKNNKSFDFVAIITLTYVSYKLKQFGTISVHFLYPAYFSFWKIVILLPSLQSSHLDNQQSLENHYIKYLSRNQEYILF